MKEDSLNIISKKAGSQMDLIKADYSAGLNNGSDTSLLSLLERNVCKSFVINRYFVVVRRKSSGESNITAIEEKKHLIMVHGSVQYDFLYRSYVDTPFTQNNFQQHTIQSALSIVVKDRYPINLNLSHRQSNSPYFRNFFDVNAQFDQHDFLAKAKRNLLERVSVRVPDYPELEKLETNLNAQLEKFNSLKQALNGPDIVQRLLKERERLYYKDRFGKDSLSRPNDLSEVNMENLFIDVRKKWTKNHPSKDSISHRLDSSSYMSYIEHKQRELDSLQHWITTLKYKKDSLKNSLSTALSTVKQKIYKARTIRDLKEIEQEYNIEENGYGAIERILSNTKSIGLGRSIVNYSELTISNVSLTGFNVEYNPNVYVALAAGKIDYGFRNFFGKSTRKLGQDIIMARLGFGDKDSKAIIFSAFTGRKYNYSSLLADTVFNRINVAGYSLEAILRKDERTSLSAEIAKTTKPVSGRFSANNELKNLSDFSDYSTMGVSIKGQMYINGTDSWLSGFFRKTGKNFQSFNLFSYSTDQTAWLLKLDQPLLKNRIGFAASLRRNDFVNPFTTKTFKSSTIFKSIQLTARFPKWPIISAGYHPGSQLYMVNDERVIENAYYIQNGSVIYAYSLNNTNIVSSFIFNKYSSKGTDSGFVAYDGISYITAHNLSLGKLQLQGTYTFTNQELIEYYTVEANADYSLTKRIRAGAGTKYNRVSGGSTYIGSRAFFGMDFKFIGSLQLHYENSYLPTTRQTLFPVEVGRLSWFKNF